MIGVSIVTFRSDRRALLESLQALAAQRRKPQVVRLHANGCQEFEAAELRVAITECCPDLDVVVTATDANLGFCEPHNTCVADLVGRGYEAVLVLNPDLMLAPNAIELLAEAATTNGTALYGPLLELADPGSLAATGRIDTMGIRWTRGGRHLDIGQGEPMTNLPTEMHDVAGLSGACVFVTAAAYRAVVEASGEFFDADFFAYREDAELGFRAGILGVPSRIVPAARGLHVRRLRGTTRRVDPFIDALGVRNRFLLAFKYGRRRPGGVLAGLGRDAVVILGVLVTERGSLPGLREALQLRPVMREKWRRLADRTTPRR